MGIFDKNYEKSADNLYEDVKKYLKPKNGKKNVIMLNTMSKALTNGFECESKYTLQINEIINAMQDDGYEILDIKMDNSLYQTVGNPFIIRTLIMYT